jgi:Domain of unknown function (DUF4965)/Domain of unknown function (DUF5127)/Domain of unknown function (DUF1793)/Domain of unknown function (DUF4964)
MLAAMERTVLKGIFLAWLAGCAACSGTTSNHPEIPDGGVAPDGEVGNDAGRSDAAPPPFVPAAIEDVRAPAYPLFTSDPYFSIWSFSDQLCDSWPRHWTGAVHGMVAMIRVDGVTHRLMGQAPANVPCAAQTRVRVTPTRTIYEFSVAGVELRLSFMSASFADDLDKLSRPVGYLTYEVRPSDGASHDVSVYFDNSAELAVNTPDQVVTWDRVDVSGLQVRRVGTTAQPVLGKRGDDLRIDWGYLHQIVPEREGVSQVVLGHESARTAFAANGVLPLVDDARKPRAANDDWPVIASAMHVPVTGGAWQARTVVLAYDDEYSIELMGQRLRPYWRRHGDDARALIAKSVGEYDAILHKAQAFDAELVDDLLAVGGPAYLRLAVLAYRQAIAAHKLVADADGTPLFFSKENYSNGCIATVDVTYPSAPLFLLVNPTLVKGMLKPVADYASSSRWHFDFAPHDLGTYPLANGQVYGGGETSEQNQMPVEESANLILLFGALAKAEGKADFAAAYWPLLEKWAHYLERQGFDPASQLSTDDFAGHLAHNVNLSAKAIVALGAYAQLAEQTGHASEAARVRPIAQSFASQWVTLASDGDHTRLAFDKPGTWSQKYNLVWDRLLGLGLFPAQVGERELAFARTKLSSYGLPLDNRAGYTKLDWTVWTATLTGKRADFDGLIAPLTRFLDQTPQRVPLTDWYETSDARQSGFQARSVVGGVFLPLLYDDALWAKWVARADSE